MLKYNDKSRKHPRYKPSAAVYYYYNNDWIECKLIDLNLDGSGLGIKNNLQKGDHIKIKLINNNTARELEAEVVNKKNIRYGTKFLNTNPRDTKFLQSIINSQSNRFKI